MCFPWTVTVEVLASRVVAYVTELARKSLRCSVWTTPRENEEEFS